MPNSPRFLTFVPEGVEFWKIRLHVHGQAAPAWQGEGGWEDQASSAYLLLTKVPGAVRIDIVPAKGRPDRLRIAAGVAPRSLAVEISDPPPLGDAAPGWEAAGE